MFVAGRSRLCRLGHRRRGVPVVLVTAGPVRQRNIRTSTLVCYVVPSNPIPENPTNEEQNKTTPNEQDTPPAQLEEAEAPKVPEEEGVVPEQPIQPTETIIVEAEATPSEAQPDSPEPKVEAYEKVDKQFESDKSKAKKMAKNRGLLFWATLAVLLGGGYAIVVLFFDWFALEVLGRLEVTPGQFETLPPEEIISRISVLSGSLQSARLREQIITEIWPIMFVIRASEHPTHLIREEALKALCLMCEYDNMKSFIVQAFNTEKLIDDILARYPYTDDDAYHYGLLSQLLDAESVQNLSVEKGMLPRLFTLLKLNDPLPRSLSIMALGKLTENEKARVVMSEEGLFEHLYESLFHSFKDPTSALDYKGTGLAHMAVPMAKKALKELYFNAAVAPTCLAYTFGEVKKNMLSLHDYDPEAESLFIKSEALGTAVSRGALFAAVWAYPRTFIRNRFKARDEGLPFAAREFRTAFKGMGKGMGGAAFLVFLLELDRIWYDLVLSNETNPTISLASNFLHPFVGVLTLWSVLRIAPFSFVPFLVGAMHARESRFETWSLLLQSKSKPDFWERVVANARLEGEKGRAGGGGPGGAFGGPGGPGTASDSPSGVFGVYSSVPGAGGNPVYGGGGLGPDGPGAPPGQSWGPGGASGGGYGPGGAAGGGPGGAYGGYGAGRGYSGGGGAYGGPGGNAN